MRYFLFFIFFISCMKGAESFDDKPIYPDKNLKEIALHGSYFPEDPQRLENRKKKYYERRRTRGVTKITPYEEAFPNSLNIWKETFGYSSLTYCYNEKQNKEAKLMPPQFRARLYDKDDNQLIERRPRIWTHISRSSSGVPLKNNLIKSEEISPENTISYLPYHEEARKIRFIRLEGKEEIVLFEYELKSLSELKAVSTKKSIILQRPPGYKFDEKRECFSAPGTM